MLRQKHASQILGARIVRSQKHTKTSQKNAERLVTECSCACMYKNAVHDVCVTGHDHKASVCFRSPFFFNALLPAEPLLDDESAMHSSSACRHTGLRQALPPAG